MNLARLTHPLLFEGCGEFNDEGRKKWIPLTQEMTKMDTT